MTPAKLNVHFAFMSYAGNGGISCIHPSIRVWWGRTLLAMKGDPRIGDITDQDYSDTPIPMTRNRSVQEARKAKADVLVMIDSDQHPDLLLGQDPVAKPFWDTAFDFLYPRHQRDQIVVIGAPYCGAPPLECPHVFRWANWQTDHPGVDHRLEMYMREEAAAMTGIGECAALATGLIMFDMRLFDLLKPPYFYYEYSDEFQQEKASTEDVTATRDMNLITWEALKQAPLHVAWDCWAGHWKPKCVGKPSVITLDQIGDNYKRAMERNRRSDERTTHVSPGPALASRIHAALRDFNGKEETAAAGS